MHFRPLENLQHLTIVLDRSGIILEVADPCPVLGSIAPTLVGKAFLNFVDAAYCSGFEAAFFAAHARPGFAAVMELGIEKPDGSSAVLEALLRYAGPGRVQLDAALRSLPLPLNLLAVA